MSNQLATNMAFAPAKLEDTRQAARHKSLLYPLQFLANDFREQIRMGLRERGHSLEPSFSSVIVNLDIDGSRLTTLAERAEMSKQAMGKLVDQLEAVGYVTRAPDPKDGRAKIVCFSKAGLQLLKDSSEIVDAIWQEYSALIGEDNLTQMRDQLEHLLRQIRELRISGIKS
jgi:DNA-binding MarR family transcriptional regulator